MVYFDVPTIRELKKYILKKSKDYWMFYKKIHEFFH
jgi:hypothetical protein